MIRHAYRTPSVTVLLIRPGDAKILDENATWMKVHPNHLILIEGHTDERGTSEYNLAPGERRAKATMNYLVSEGLQATRITLISYGKERDHASAPKGRVDDNRRSDIVVREIDEYSCHDAVARAGCQVLQSRSLIPVGK